MRFVPTTLLAAAFALAAVHCGAPITNTPVNDIPKLTSLETVMDNQATVADPQWKKIGETSYADADWAASREMTNSSTQAGPDRRMKFLCTLVEASKRRSSAAAYANESTRRRGSS